LDIVFHFDFSGGIGLHALNSQFFDGFLEFLLLFFPADGKLLFHFDVFLEAFLDLISGPLDADLAFLFEGPLDLIEFLDALISEREVLFSHFADQNFDVAGLFFECFGVLVIFFLKFLPKLVDELVFGGDDLLKGLFLLVDCLDK
jgi:hypothetical protein